MVWQSLQPTGWEHVLFQESPLTRTLPACIRYIRPRRIAGHRCWRGRKNSMHQEGVAATPRNPEDEPHGEEALLHSWAHRPTGLIPQERQARCHLAAMPVGAHHLHPAFRFRAAARS